LNKFIISAIILITIFVILSIAVSPKLKLDGNIIKTDNKLLIDMINSRVPWLNPAMIFMTEYGREAVWPILIIILAIFGGRDGRKTALIVSIVMIALIPISIVAKDLIARDRPILASFQYLLQTDNEYSFPSGHATIVAGGAATILALFGGNRKTLISIALTLEAALVCASRVYLGQHYPLDVIGGIILGVGVSFIFVGVSNKIEVAVSMLLRKGSSLAR
jgi:membrane-associated phospholipid phosphatase